MAKNNNYSFKNQSALKNWLIAIDGPFRVSPMGKETQEQSLIDTFDWRLLQSGLILWRTTSDYTLQHEKKKKIIASCASGGNSEIVFWWQFPHGKMAKWLKKAADVRALMIKLNLRESHTSWRVADRKGKMLGKMVWTERVVGADNRLIPLPPIVSLDPGLQDKIGRELARSAHPCKTSSPDLEALWKIAGVEPLATQRKRRTVSLTPDQSAIDACRAILIELTNIMEMNERGIIDDIDSEFLHEYRVALRKIRALLAQMRRILPQENARIFRLEWSRWVRQTNRLRDLDVCLLKEVTYRSMVEKKLRPGLTPIFQRLRGERQKEWALVRDMLLGAGYQKFKEGWYQFIKVDLAVVNDSKRAKKEILPLATKILRRRSEKIVHLHNAFRQKALSKAFHRLRLQCKKLRYGLEFFNGLFPAGQIARLLAPLRFLQDLLGEYNDLGNQMKELILQEKGLALENRLSPLTGKTIKALNRKLLKRQEKVRRDVVVAVRRFYGKKNRSLIAALFD